MIWVLLGLACWLVAGLAFAWVFGEACRVGRLPEAPPLVRFDEQSYRELRLALDGKSATELPATVQMRTIKARSRLT